MGIIERKTLVLFSRCTKRSNDQKRQQTRQQAVYQSIIKYSLLIITMAIYGNFQRFSKNCHTHIRSDYQLFISLLWQYGN